jgi:hypothetical protein
MGFRKRSLYRENLICFLVKDHEAILFRAARMGWTFPNGGMHYKFGRSILKEYPLHIEMGGVVPPPPGWLLFQGRLKSVFDHDPVQLGSVVPVFPVDLPIFPGHIHPVPLDGKFGAVLGPPPIDPVGGLFELEFERPLDCGSRCEFGAFNGANVGG